MAQKISVEVDVNTKEVKFAGGEVTRLAQQVRVLTEELNRMQAAGQVGSEKYQILVEKLNDTKDAMDRTKLAAGEIYGTLSAIPGPIGEISSKLNTTIDSFKLLGSLKTTELRAQFTGLLKDVKEAGSGFLNFIGYNKVYEKVLLSISQAERVKVAAQKAAEAAQEGVTKTTKAADASNKALATSTANAAVATNAQGTASKTTTGAITTQTVVTTGATIATRIFAAALAALPFVGLAIAISAVVGYITDYISKTEEATTETDKLNAAISETKRKEDLAAQERERKNKLRISELKKRGASEEEIFKQLESDAFIARKRTEQDILKRQQEFDKAKLNYQVLSNTKSKEEDIKAARELKNETEKALQDAKTADADALIALRELRADYFNKQLEKQEEQNQKSREKTRKANADRLKDLEELQKGEKDAFLATLSDQEKEEYAVSEKYAKLYVLAVKFGEDTKQLKESEEIELGKIRKKYSEQEVRDKEEADKKAADKIKQQTDLKKSLQEKESSELLETVKNEFDKRTQQAEKQAADRLTKYEEELNKAKELLGYTQEEINRKLAEFRETNQKALEVVKEQIADDSAAKKLDQTLKLLQVQAEGLVQGTKAYYENRKAILDASLNQELLNAEKEIQVTEDLEKRKEAIRKKYAALNKQLRQEEFNEVLGFIVKGFDAFKSVADAQLAVQDANKTVELENAKATIKDKEKLAIEQDKINEKYFYKQKGAQKAQAYISTFQAAVSAYAAMAAIPVVGPVLGAIAAAAAIVAGLANVKKIDATTYTSTISDTGSSNANAGVGTKFAKGGVLSGPSHAQGGIKTRFGELEGGEYVVNKRSTQSFMPLLSAINSVGNRKYANGGMMPTMDSIKELMAAQQMPIVKTYVVASEMTSQQEANKKLQDLAKI